MNVNKALQQCNYISQDSLFLLHRQMKDALYDPYMRLSEKETCTKESNFAYI